MGVRVRFICSGIRTAKMPESGPVSAVYSQTELTCFDSWLLVRIYIYIYTHTQLYTHYGPQFLCCLLPRAINLSWKHNMRKWALSSWWVKVFVTSKICVCCAWPSIGNTETPKLVASDLRFARLAVKHHKLEATSLCRIGPLGGASKGSSDVTTSEQETLNCLSFFGAFLSGSLLYTSPKLKFIPIIPHPCKHNSIARSLQVLTR